jgi:hypothetical protein
MIARAGSKCRRSPLGNRRPFFDKKWAYWLRDTIPGRADRGAGRTALLPEEVSDLVAVRYARIG